MAAPTGRFFADKEIENEPPADLDFSEIRNAHLCRQAQNQHAGTGDFDDMGRGDDHL
jgi:hypothetical protein